MKKGFAFFLIAILLVGLLNGCGESDDENSYQVYYLNMETTKMSPVSYVPQAKSNADIAQELLQQLMIDPQKKNLRHTIPTTVEVRTCTFNGYSLIIDFSEEYNSLSTTEEVLVRAAIVKTLLQIDGIYYVSFTVDSNPLRDKNGNLIGSMSVDSFVENPGEQINSIIETTLTLYFASKDGTALVKETRTVPYSSNISLDKLVMEQLISGPETADGLQTIPSGTRLITISTVDAICYVNLDETFLNQNIEITEQAVLFSIVDSLTELSTVDKVQISVNGDTKGKCRYDYELSKMYERDDSIIIKSDEEASEVEAESSSDADSEID